MPVSRPSAGVVARPDPVVLGEALDWPLMSRTSPRGSGSSLAAATAPTPSGLVGGSTRPTSARARFARSTRPRPSAVASYSRHAATGVPHGARPVPRSTGGTPISSSAPASTAVRACPRLSRATRRCSPPSRRRRSGRSTRAESSAGVRSPADLGAKPAAARMASGWTAALGTRRTIPASASRYALPATTTRRPSCGTRWRRSCGAGPRSTSGGRSHEQPG